MLESKEFLLPRGKDNESLRVIAVGFDERSLIEMQGLLVSLDINLVSSVFYQKKKVNPSTYIGKGKLEELSLKVKDEDAQVVIFDFELSSSQFKKIEKELKAPILDRSGVILEIFSRHARTKESKTQVELARLQYIMPRLTHYWTHFERQRGGSVGQRGMGEKQIEVDRRLMQRRMSLLKKKLVAIEKERIVQRAKRKEVLKVALVGYTNAGKSTLLNALTHSDVLVENKLFATLDATARTLDPNSHPPVVAIDTVGFISRIPTFLIASFKSTLEELHEAELLIHVVDASSVDAQSQIETTQKVLEELNLKDKKIITVLNKIDQVKSVSQLSWAKVLVPGGLRVSAFNVEDVVKLRQKVLSFFREQFELYEILVPYSNSKLESQLHVFASIESMRYLDKGTFYRLKIDKKWASRLNLNRFKI